MIFKIDEYIFDSQRLIFYPAAVTQESVLTINSNIPSNDNYDELSGELCKLDADNLNAKSILPTTAGICLTYKCQLHCNYCSFSSKVDGYEIDFSSVRTFVNFLLRNVIIKKIAVPERPEPLVLYFTGGGEPTLNWGLFQETVEYIKKKCNEKQIEYHLHLTTNGILNEEQVLYIATNFSSIMVSFDGSSDVQNKNRKSAGNRETSKIVSNTLSLLDQMDAPYSIRTTIWQSDFDKMREMVDYIYTYFKNNKGWSISPILVTGRAVDEIKKDYLNENKYNFIESFVDAANYAMKTYGAENMSIKLFANTFSDIFCGSCYIANPWLMPDSTICTCLEGKNNIPVIGYAIKDRVVLLESYEDKLLKEYRKRFLSKECRECIAFRFCRTGCPLKFIEDEVSGMEASRWTCQMTRFYWKYVFRQILSGNAVFGWTLETIENIEDIDFPIYKLMER